MNVTGFGGHFEVLFDQARLPSRLPLPFRQIYGGDWHPLTHPSRPYTFINFVASRDGRISFAEPGHLGGGEVGGFSKADAWLMGLLRAGADAVLVGDGTLRLEPNHIWTSPFIFPSEAEGFAALRQYLELKPLPLHVFLSLRGDLEAPAAVFQQANLHILVATTQWGKEKAETLLKEAKARVEVLKLGEESVDLHALMHLLLNRYQVKSLLCEGGPRVYGSLLKAGLVDEEFLTLSPLMIGSEAGKVRPSLVEGVAFQPGQAPQSKLVSLRREGEHLFLRSRWHYAGAS
jgi:5-amino-6-(5-phosphoribosylamino)uracil reductase